MEEGGEGGLCFPFFKLAKRLRGPLRRSVSINFNFVADSIDLRQNELRRLTETLFRYYGLLTTYLLDVPRLSTINGVNLTQEGIFSLA